MCLGLGRLVLGASVGAWVGASVGAWVGASVGAWVGACVGACVGAWVFPPSVVTETVPG